MMNTAKRHSAFKWTPRFKWTPAFIALLSIVLLLAACGKESTEKTAGTALNKGSAAPMFDLKDLDGNEVKLASLAGEKVYVKYWASWCPICLSGMEELNTLAGQSNDFKVISIVSPDFKGEQSEADFKQWFSMLQADQTADKLTVLLDEGGKWAQKFGVRGYPTSYYIGSDGVLVQTAPGHHANDEITAAFAEIK